MRAIFFVLIIGFSGVTQAVLNIESVRKNTEELGYYGSASASFSGKSGNSEISRFSIENHIGYRAEGSNNFLILSAHYGKSAGQRNVHNYQAHARHVRQWSNLWSGEAFIQQSADDFRQLSRRDLLGSGVRFGQRINKKQHLFVGLGAFHEEERLTDQSTDSVFRVSSYVDIKRALTPQLQLSAVSYWQPVVSDMGDFRFLQQGKLTLSVSEKVSFYVKLDVNHDNIPPVGVEKTDIKYANGLTYRF